MKFQLGALLLRKRARRVRLFVVLVLFVVSVYFLLVKFGYPTAAPFLQTVDDAVPTVAITPTASFPLQKGVKSLEERRALFKEYCTSSKVFKDNGAWCLRDRTPPVEFAPGHRFSSQHVVADKHFAMMLMKLLGEDDVVDLGAGLGQYGVRFSQLGRKSGKYVAFDGAVNIEDFTNNYVQYADLTKPLVAPYDWVISFEVGEHIPKQHQDHYVENLVKNALKGMVISWAVPKQGGHGHVNERSNEDVTEQMNGLGFSYDKVSSDLLRGQVRDRGSRHLRNTTMLFRRRENLPGINTWETSG